MALNAGVPVALVGKITGNAAVKVVLKHYYQPDRHDLQAKIGGAMAGLTL